MNAILALILRGLLLVLTYVFVGWIGYTILKDLRSLFARQSEPVASTIFLRSSINQDPIEMDFSKPEIILGRDPDCEFTIPDETISLRHCKLSYHHKQWWANDLNSTNGTFLNQDLIESAVILTNGDVLRLGNVSIIVQINQ
ncbi:MAG: FHA domain-containing protein [Brevefilum sp.]|nr:FHA domain-containing protein [Brevefilum sp.]